MSASFEKVYNALKEQVDAADASFFSSCVHCGMCTDACHYVLANPGDPTYAPAYKADRIRKLFKKHFDWTGRVFPWWVKAGDVMTDEDLEELKDTVFGKCTNCRRCTFNCPMRVDLATFNRMARGLLVSVGMTSEQLAGMLYDSLRNKLMPLPDETIVYPAHGAGSACGKNLARETSASLGSQKRGNWALQPMSKEQFVSELCANQPHAPGYFAWSADYNRRERPMLEEVIERSMVAIPLEQALEHAVSEASLDAGVAARLAQDGSELELATRLDHAHPESAPRGLEGQGRRHRGLARAGGRGGNHQPGWHHVSLPPARKTGCPPIAGDSAGRSRSSKAQSGCPFRRKVPDPQGSGRSG